MAVEIWKEAVDVLGTCSVPIPLASIVSQKYFVLQEV